MFARTIFVLSVLVAYAMAQPYMCPPPMLNGCEYDTATDMTSSSEIIIAFSYPVYEPPCVKINAGQMISFIGSFYSHPLEGGVANETSAIPATEGPFFPTVDADIEMWNITFTEEGAFPYYCQVESHYTEGMFGAIYVGAGCYAPPVMAPVAPPMGSTTPVAPVAPVAAPMAAPVAAPIKKSDASQTLIFSAAGFVAAAALL